MAQIPSKIPASLRRYCRQLVPLFIRQSQGRRILALIREILKTEKWVSFDQFHKTTRTLVRAFKEAGAVAEVYQIPTGGPVGNGRWVIHQATDVRTATLDIIQPVRKRIVDYAGNPWQVIQWSTGTPPGGIKCRLVVIDQEEELNRVPAGRLAGKLVLTRLNARRTARRWAEKGAVGIITDPPVKDYPQATAWTKFGWGGIPLETGPARLVGLVVSSREGDFLRKLVRKRSPVQVLVKADIRHYKGTFDLVSGLVPGSGNPQEEVWALAHSTEPGALDNASGMAVCVEIARLMEKLIAQGLIHRPRRTIRLLSGYECFSFFHYLEHGRRLSPPVAGVCIDSLGAKPVFGSLGWYETVPMAAGFADDVGEVILKKALKASGGYRYERRPFVATLDTLIGDPRYGFPCPWIHSPSPGYHSSADTVDHVSAKGIGILAAGMAAYLHYLADMATDQALELADWQTKKTFSRIKARGRRLSRDKKTFVLDQQTENLIRLRRFLWGGTKPDIERKFAEYKNRLRLVGGNRARITPGTGKKWSAGVLVPFRKAPLAPWHENIDPPVAKLLQTTGLPSWAHYWADGRRNLSIISRRLATELGRTVLPEKAERHFRALEDLGYVKLVEPKTMVTFARLVRDLRRIGIKSGMDLMVHSSLSRVGYAAGGPQTVIEAILAVIGKKGTLLVPSFNHGRAQVYNPLTTPTTNGAIPQAIWQRQDAVRSLHPTHAFAAVGPKAALWCAGHLAAGGFGPGSPLDRLIKEGGYILGLGVTTWALSAYHVAEVNLGCGCLGMFGDTGKIINEKGEVQEVPAMAWRNANCPVSIAKMDLVLKRKNLWTHGRVGNADSFLVKGLDFYRVRQEQLKKVCPTCTIKPG